MRCSCQICDTYMTHSESLDIGCVCPNRGYRCNECLGTDSVISREQLKDNAELFKRFADDADSMLDERLP